MGSGSGRRSGSGSGLYVETHGRGERLVLAHGFTQNGRCWGPLGDDLAADHEVALVDLPGHGATPADHDDASLDGSGELLIQAGGEAVYVGYSMGGRIALHSALAHPDQVRGLVLIGATAGIDEPDARDARRQADEALAERLLRIGLAPFLDQWLANPLFASLPGHAAGRAERLTNRPSGLAATLRHRGTGAQQPLWDRLGELSMPVLVLAGSDDDKFCTTGRRLVDSLPDASLRILPGTHAVHLEQPTTIAGTIRSFVHQISGELD